MQPAQFDSPVSVYTKIVENGLAIIVKEGPAASMVTAELDAWGDDWQDQQHVNVHH